MCKRFTLGITPEKEPNVHAQGCTSDIFLRALLYSHSVDRGSEAEQASAPFCHSLQKCALQLTLTPLRGPALTRHGSYWQLHTKHVPSCLTYATKFGTPNAQSTFRQYHTFFAYSFYGPINKLCLTRYSPHCLVGAAILLPSMEQLAIAISGGYR